MKDSCHPCVLALQPLASATSAQFYGTIAMGRQVTAPPQLYSRRMPVGRHRHPQIPVTVKGSRALVKVYTDVHLEVQEANACYGPGLEPKDHLEVQTVDVCYRPGLESIKAQRVQFRCMALTTFIIMSAV